jgi:hypothetical protein
MTQHTLQLRHALHFITLHLYSSTLSLALRVALTVRYITFIHTYIYTCIDVCICLCMCVFAAACFPQENNKNNTI